MKNHLKNLNPNFKRGVIAANYGQHQDALKLLTKAIKDNPDDHMAYYNRGMLYEIIGKNDKALADYSKSIKCKCNCNLSRCGWAYVMRGNLKIKMGDYIGGAEDHLSAVEIDPGLAGCYTQKSRVNSANDTKRIKKALGILNKHISKHPDDAEGYAKRSVIFLNLGKVADAIDDVLKMISLNPKTEFGHLYLGICYIENRMYPEAIKNIKKALKIFPDKLSVTRYLGIAYQLTKSYDNAVKCFTKVIKEMPDFVDAYERRYLCLIELGKHKLARKDKRMINKLLAA